MINKVKIPGHFKAKLEWCRYYSTKSANLQEGDKNKRRGKVEES